MSNNKMLHRHTFSPCACGASATTVMEAVTDQLVEAYAALDAVRDQLTVVLTALASWRRNVNA